MNDRYGRDYDDDDYGSQDDGDERRAWSERANRPQHEGARGEGRERSRGYGQQSFAERRSSGYDPQRNHSGQPGQYGQYGQYGQGQYGQGERYAQRGAGYGGQFGQGAHFGQRGQYGGSYAQGGQFGQGGQYPQRGQYGSSQAGQGHGQGWSSDRREPYFPEPRYDRPNDSVWSESTNWTSGRDNATPRRGASFGKGPKGYTRSDDRIREDVCDRLSDDDEVDASDITVTVKAGEVTLEGTVVDRRSKHRAEDIAESVGGVKDVHNSLRAQKSLLKEMGDRVTGRDEPEQHGHSGSGTRNSGSSSASNARS